MNTIKPDRVLTHQPGLKVYFVFSKSLLSPKLSKRNICKWPDIALIPIQSSYQSRSAFMEKHPTVKVRLLSTGTLVTITGIHTSIDINTTGNESTELAVGA